MIDHDLINRAAEAFETGEGLLAIAGPLGFPPADRAATLTDELRSHADDLDEVIEDLASVGLGGVDDLRDQQRVLRATADRRAAR